MRPIYRWIISPPSKQAGPLASALRTSPLIAQILLNRGLATAEQCRQFLSPSLKHLHEPAELPNAVAAAQHIVRAVRDRKRIVIYGDYDVDGITGIAILWHAIRLLGGQADYYIPHRLEEGYGLNSEALAQICDAGAQLVVTVDCGITAIEQARLALDRGVEIIITDHHDLRRADAGADAPPVLPECTVAVHPRLPGSRYPNPWLCGAGVALKVAWAMGQIDNPGGRVGGEYRQFLLEATSLAALGTIADVVPLRAENRVLAHYGLGGLRRSRLEGIKALIKSAGLTGKELDSYHVGFMLAPRLNAAGRMGHAREAAEMLTTADAPTAARIAAALEAKNRERQALEKRIFEEAMAQVAAHGWDSVDHRALVLAAPHWHAGVIGIVASRVVNRLNRPTVMIAACNGHGHGSARSIPGFNLAEALNACRAHLEACGGHEMAAGLRVRMDKVDEFREAFCQYALQRLAPEQMQPRLELECAARLAQMTPALVRELARLGPFGTGNPRPVLFCPDVEITAPPRRVGRNGEHVQVLIRQDETRMKCVAFSQSDLAGELRPGMRVDLAAEPIINDFNGSVSVELEIRDVRPACR